MTKTSGEVPELSSPESAESYEKELESWGSALVDRALKDDLPGEECALIEDLVKGTVRAGLESFSPETGKWTQGIFYASLRRRAKSSNPKIAAWLQLVFAKGDGILLPPVSGESSTPVVEESAAAASEGDLEQELNKYSPDPTETLEQGELIAFKAVKGEEDWTFLGVDGPNSRVGVFGRKDEHGQLVFHRQDVSDFAAQEEEQPSAEYASATAEPPEAIGNVSVVIPPASGESEGSRISPEDFDRISPQKEKVIAGQLNDLKKEIDAQWEIVNANKTQKDDAEARKKYNAANRELDRLLQLSKNLALDLAGDEIVIQSVKLADPAAIARYNAKVGKVTREDRAKKEKESGLSKEELDARYDALRRKDAFAEALTVKGVERDVAMNLYQEFIKRAGELVWLEAELLAGRNDVLTGPRARKALEWHGIDARQPVAVLTEITPVLEGYHTIPPREERSQKRSAEEKGGKTAPLHERVLSGEVKVETLPDELLKKLAVNKLEGVKKMAEQEILRRSELEKVRAAIATLDEESLKQLVDNHSDGDIKKKAKAELARREKEKKGKEKSKRTQPLFQRILAAFRDINEGVPDAAPPPSEVLKDYADEPEVAAFIKDKKDPMKQEGDAQESGAVSPNAGAQPGNLEAGADSSSGVNAEEERRLVVEKAFPAAMEVIRKMLDPNLSLSEFQALAEGYLETNGAAGVSTKGQYDEVSWSAPNGRTITFGWNLDGSGNRISWTAGPNDIAGDKEVQKGANPTPRIEVTDTTKRATYRALWNEKTPAEQKEIIDLCRASFHEGQEYLVETADGVRLHTLLEIKDDGNARMTVRDTVPEGAGAAVSDRSMRWVTSLVPLEELIDKNPDILPKKEIKHEPETEADKHRALYKARWDAKTDAEKAETTANCKKFFMVNQNYLVERGDGKIEPWLLSQVLDDGHAHLYRLGEKPGEILSKDVLLEELIELNPSVLPAVEETVVDKRLKQIAEYADRWNQKTDAERKAIIEQSRAAFHADEPYFIRRTDGTIESWVLVGIRDDGDAHMGHPERVGVRKDVQLLELIELNPSVLPEENAASSAVAPADDDWASALKDYGGTPRGESAPTGDDWFAAGAADAAASLPPEPLPAEASVVEAGPPTPETLESLEKKKEIVGSAWFVWDTPADGESLEGKWDRVEPLGMQMFHDALVASGCPNLDEGKFNATPKDAAYLEELAQWLHNEYEQVILPSLEKMRVEQGASQPGAVAPALDGDVPVPADAGEPPPAPGATAPSEAKDIAPLNHAVAKQLEEKFGISEGDLESIEVFRELSVGQQLLVLKNLEQLTLTDIKKEAQTQQKEESAKAGLVGRAVRSFMTLGMHPEIRTAQIEKELLKKSRGKGGAIAGVLEALEKKLANIEELARVAKAGPDVEVKNGELRINYISKKDLWDEGDVVSPEQEKVLEAFNTAASNFAKIPHEWGYDSAELTKEERKQYREARRAYLLARGDLARLYLALFAENGMAVPFAAAMGSMNVLDERMQMNQLFNTHPDAEAALQDIEDGSVLAAGAKEFWKKKGMFVVYGAAARAATLALLGTMPVVGAVVAYAGGAGIAGMVGKKIGETEAKRMFKAKRVDGRMSEEDLREKIAVTKKETGEVILNADGKPLTRKIKEFTDATFFTDRVERLVDKLSGTSAPDERAQLEKKIAQTVALMHEKLEAGLVNFGGSSLEDDDGRKGDTIGNRLSFIQAMALGRAQVTIDNDNLEMEFSRMIKLHEQKIDEVRKKEIAKAGVKAGMWRAGFALAGAGLVQGAKAIMDFGEVGPVGVPVAAVEHFKADQIKTVGDAIRNEPNTSNLPDDVFRSSQAAEAKAFEDYMKYADPETRAKTLETIGMDQKSMDLRIARILAKAAATPSAAPGHELGGAAAPAAPQGQAPAATPAQAPAEAVPYAKASPDSANPEAFKGAEFDKNISDVIGRTPSPEELSALRSTGGVDNPAQANMDMHTELIKALSISKTPLTHDAIERLMGRAPSLPAVPALLSHEVVSGENLTKILRGADIPDFKDLSPRAQENAIQNFIKRLSADELKEIGITDPENLRVGETIDLNKVAQLLHEKKIGGEGLLERASHITEQPPENASVPDASHAETGADATAKSAGSPVAPANAVPPSGDRVSNFGVGTRVGETEVAWSELDHLGKMMRAEQLSDRYVTEGVNKLFVKGPFEEWPKEWIAVRGRDAIELLNQTEKTVYSPLPGTTQEIPAGYEWSVAEKIQRYITENGLTLERGFFPHEKETVEEFLKRALQEKIMRDGPLPKSSAQMATGGMMA